MQHLGTGDVGRQQVRGELDAAEVRIQILREALDGARLGQTRQAFNQQVTVGQQTDQQSFDNMFLADDRLRHAFM